MEHAKFINAVKNSKGIKVHIPDVDNFVNNHYVKKLRSNLEVTQAVFAVGLGVSNKTVEKWEQGSIKVGSAAKRLIYLIKEDNSLFTRLYSTEFVNFAENYVEDNIAYSTNVLSVHDSEADILNPYTEQNVKQENIPRVREVYYAR